MRKGFVGPLGDDIPSIFPIVAGILLFIGTIFYAHSTIEAKNRDLDQRSATLGLAYIVTEKGFLSKEDFDSKCANIIKPFSSARNLRFAVVVKKFCKEIDLQSNPFNKITEGSAEGFECTNDEPALSAARKNQEKAPKNAIVLNYPVAVQDPCGAGTITNGLGLINVITWR